jgi:uncharacterized protein YceH (UPF0502 family)
LTLLRETGPLLAGEIVMTDQPSAQPQSEPRWQPLSAIDRRVVGVLIEKAKTTPDVYPMSLNAVVTGCNQKSNRHPLTNLEPDDVEQSLDRLREMGAVGLIQGYGRVQKYRHYMYEWLGVDKVESAVMTELLLRGPQTEGELRGRASRMEPIQDLNELRQVLSSLKAKGLVIPLTPEGRGHVVSHALYPAGELERVRTQYAQGGPMLETAEPASSVAPAASAPPAASPRPVPSAAPQPAVPEATDAVRRELTELRTQVTQLRSDLADLTALLHQTVDELERFKAELGG